VGNEGKGGGPRKKRPKHHQHRDATKGKGKRPHNAGKGKDRSSAQRGANEIEGPAHQIQKATPRGETIEGGKPSEERLTGKGPPKKKKSMIKREGRKNLGGGGGGWTPRREKSSLGSGRGRKRGLT